MAALARAVPAMQRATTTAAEGRCRRRCIASPLSGSPCQFCCISRTAGRIQGTTADVLPDYFSDHGGENAKLTTMIRRSSGVGFVTLVAALAMLVGVHTNAHGALAGTMWFHSPSGNISCEVSPGGTRGRHAYCQTVHPPASALLRANSSVHTCHGQRCLGNGPENAFTLRYGRSVLVGPFHCTSSRDNGMRCVGRQTGRGFVIGLQGITTLG
jgi:hypothetical protein